MTSKKIVDFANMDVTFHTQYAESQAVRDAHLIADAAQIPAHSNLLGTSTIFQSEWAKLFEVYSSTYASFAPPPGYFKQARRFFREKIVPPMVEGAPAEMFKLVETLAQINEWIAFVWQRVLQYQKG